MGLFDNILSQNQNYIQPQPSPVPPPTPAPNPLYQPFHQVTSQTAADPFHALLAQLLKPATQPSQPLIPWSNLISAVTHPDVVGEANRLSSLPSYAAGSMSPFNTGFFNTYAQRRQVASNRNVGAGLY